MNAAAWTLTVILALAFLGAAALKTLLTKPALREKGLFWVDDFSETSVRGIAFAEFAGALGLVLPWTLHTARFLTPLAAACLAIVMASATVVHLRRGERTNAIAPIVLAAMCVALAVIRARQL